MFYRSRKEEDTTEAQTEQLIKTLTEMKGTSGHEGRIREFRRNELTPLVDRIEQDGLGGIFGVRDSKQEDAPRIMIAAHMDEVGFMVTNITPNGMFKVSPLGGWNPYVVSAQRFTLLTRVMETIQLFHLQSHHIITCGWWSTISSESNRYFYSMLDSLHAKRRLNMVAVLEIQSFQM